MSDTEIKTIIILRSADLAATRDAVTAVAEKFPNAQITLLTQKTVEAALRSLLPPTISLERFPYKDFNLAVPPSATSGIPACDLALSIYKNTGEGYEEVDAFLASHIRAKFHGGITDSLEIKYRPLSSDECERLIDMGLSLLHGGSKLAKSRSAEFTQRHCPESSAVVLSGDSEISIDNGGKFEIADETICRFGYIQPEWCGVRDDGKAVARIQNGATMVVEGSCNFMNGVKINLFKDAVFRIGLGSYVGFNSRIFAESAISIGENCAISWDVEIMDTDFHRISLADKDIGRSDVIIGNSVWIGAGAKILKGVTLGDNVLVAAHAVVAKSFPPNAIVAGNPAKLIGERKDHIRV